ncbi:MAG: hypothetical protein ACREGA_03330 [Candidatus Saccharimonadales bacterium]
MSPLVLLIIIILIPVLAALLLKFNAGILFMSLCAGDVLVRYVPHSSAAVLPQTQNISGNGWQLILLLVPPVVVAVITFRSVKGGAKQLANLLPALGTGLLLLFLAQPLLPGSSSQSLAQLSQWHSVNNYRPEIIVAAAAVSLFFIWFQRQKSGNSKKSKA